MKKRNFPGFVGAKTIGFSERHFDLVVQALDYASRNRFFGPEIIEQNLPMFGKAGGNGLEWLEAGAPDSLAPTVEELTGPSRRDIAPEVFEGSHQPKGSDGSQARMLQLSHAPALAGRPIPPVLEQRPAEFLQARHQSGLAQRPGFIPADFIDGLIELLTNVKAVQDVQRAEPAFDGRQVGGPHIRADVADAGADLGSQTVETPQQRRLAPVVADPQQAGQVFINLVNQGPKHSAHAHADFVDANGLDVFQLPVSEAMLDDPLNRGIHVGPGYMKAVGCFIPGKFARPTSQEQPKAVTQTVFSRNPGDLLDQYATGGAFDPAHRVKQDQREFEQRRQDPNSGLRCMVIGGTGSTTATAPRLGTPSRHHHHFDRAEHGGRVVHRLVNEPLDRLHIVEYRFECNGIHEGLVPHPTWVGQSFSIFTFFTGGQGSVERNYLGSGGNQLRPLAPLAFHAKTRSARFAR